MSHLTVGQRYIIQTMYELGHTQEEIGEKISRHKSVISRELSRNKDKRDGKYKANQAERKYRNRLKTKPKQEIFTEQKRENVDYYLSQYYSPEQIKGHCAANNIPMVSPERIYQYLWDDKRKGGKLYTYLRRRGRKQKKRGNKIAARGLIPNRVGIEHRPEIVELKKRFGDLEIDTVVGKDHLNALVTINDRASGMLKMKRVKRNTAELVSQAAIDLLENWKPFIKTITADNGKEFAKHEEIAENLMIDLYFADPYASWQRGANENLNGLVRQFFPKSTDFNLITDQQVQEAEDLINQRPRKRFNFISPIQMMDKLLFH